ncbi:L-serine ammonia-lyase [Tilletiaria anomala UBC 951]|uniref:L-serine ammonia-lyase n=1 Tax=Tilletiaria anomala (strain ATCC 24038 / CBS 436.72 / UBC 951) TaxID=1037660 RepID=A0A066WQR0_TILAU|nr:L-serine ammonia-lyase [Tilletiaria anomala UBC 951]KDN52980.1 L-serine ammonia-lyase [Tilletiaria anomala UBC 951]
MRSLLTQAAVTLRRGGTWITLSGSAAPLSTRLGLTAWSEAARTISRPGGYDLRPLRSISSSSTIRRADIDTQIDTETASNQQSTEHAVVSFADLFSIGIGPSSSHTIGPMRAAGIFISDLKRENLLNKVRSIKVSLFGSLAATGEGHHTPQALLLGLEGADCETVDTFSIEPRFEAIKRNGTIVLGKDTEGDLAQEVTFVYDKDLEWHWDKRLPLHSNGMRMTVFDQEGDLLAVNDYYSIGGGFVVNGSMATASSPAGMSPALPASVEDRDEVMEAETGSLQVLSEDAHSHPVDLAENVFYKEIDRKHASSDRRHGQTAAANKDVSALIPAENAPASSSPESSIPYPFKNAASLLSLSKRHNLTIAQIVFQNERTWYTPEQIREKLFRIWHVMDNCIREGTHAPEGVLPGGLNLKRRAPRLYRGLLRGFYPGVAAPSSNPEDPTQLLPPSSEDGPFLLSRNGGSEDSTNSSSATVFRPPPPPPVRVIRGDLSHPIMPVPPKRTVFPAMDFLSTYAIAVNEVNASGGRVVTSPTLGASGVIPSVLKYHLEFISDDPDRDVQTFLLTAAAVGMLVRRGATISAAEGGCQAEVGVACSMASAGLAAVLGAPPEIIAQAAEIGLEHNLGLTCDPIHGLVQAPCIERNALGAVKAVNAAQLALAGDGQHAVSLDNVIEAMRQTARAMHTHYKETSKGGLSAVIKVPVAVPAC